MSKTSDDLLLAAGAGDKIVLFEMINSSLAILTFVEKHPALGYSIRHYSYFKNQHKSKLPSEGVAACSEGSTALTNAINPMNRV